MEPTIDIIVPTYNRPGDIEKFVEEIRKQTYNNYKVFIIDDCGDYNIEKFIPKNTDKFYFEKLTKNSGQTYVRNYAVSITEGDIIVFMDDDAWFIENDDLEKIAKYFLEDPEMGVLMFDIKEPNREILSKRKNLSDLQEIGNFIACGCAFSRKSFDKTTGFSTIFHSYGEETEITMQMIKNDFKIKFGEKIKVFHNYNPSERNLDWLKRFKYNSVRNDLLIVLTRFPWFLVPFFFVGKFLSHIFYCFKIKKDRRVNLKEAFSALFSSLVIYKDLERDALTFSEFKYWFLNRI